MKSIFPSRWWIALAAAGLVIVPLTYAGPDSTAFRQAKGTYDVTLTATGSAPGFGSERIPATPGVLRLPAKRGNLVISAQIEGRSVRIPGKVTDAKVRQGGKVVVYTGRVRIPPSALALIPADVSSQSPDDLINQIPESIRSQIPQSLLDEFRKSGIQGLAGTLTGTFRTTVNLKGKKPKVVATADVAAAGASGKAKAVGTQR